VWHVLADMVVAFHAGYVAFVVFGFALIIVGYFAEWRWVRGPAFRLAHLAAILAVCVEASAGWTCPLTTLENVLRHHSGISTYGGDFIEHWLDWVIFYKAPAWVFTIAYLAFGALVIATLWLVPPRLPWTGAHRQRPS
jgi:Protein of Unknown function (DUF2784)